jgi:hypothetical protein
VNRRRLALYAGLLLVVALAGLGLVYWGLVACAPAPLPGDELWTARRHFSAALDLVLRLGSTACFTESAAGTAALWLGTRTAGVLALCLAAFVLWESVGRAARLRYIAWRGGHVVLAGVHDDLSELARVRRLFAGPFFLAPDRAAAAELARRRPFAEIVPVAPARLARQLAHLGAGRAGLLAAATRNDLTNVAIAEAALAAPGSGELLVRLEQHSVRTLSSHRLRLQAMRQGRELAVVSLTQLQARRGLAAAMPGRFTLGGAARVHIGLCGSGDALQAASFAVARQGYGLESGPPLISILRTGSGDFAPGALQRLATAGIAEIDVTDVMSAAADGLDRAVAAMLEAAPPLAAMHCIGAVGGEAEALALRVEEVLLALHQPVPPIVAYAGHDRPLGVTGMIRVAATEDLARARDVARLMDRRARAVHQHYLDGLAAARAGADSAPAPSEVAWERLPEAAQDDNRNVADQMDYALATLFMLARPGPAGTAFDAAETERLAGLAHARWMAAKALGGWRLGPFDARRLLHPDMLAYAELDEAARQKDRDIVASIPPMAALAGEAVQRERRVGFPRPLAGAALAAAVAALAATPKDAVPVAVLPLDDADMVRLAGALLERGLRIEALLDQAVDALRAGDAAPRLAEVLRRAWRIHVVRAGDARAALPERAKEKVDATGAINA